MAVSNIGSNGKGKEFRAFGTINFLSKNSKVRKAIRKCEKLKHSRRETNIGRCFNRYTCDKCGFSYEIDSSD
jgi:transposase-like protein